MSRQQVETIVARSRTRRDHNTNNNDDNDDDEESIFWGVDRETRDLLIRKTWCHGQSILPFYSLFLLGWFIHHSFQPLMLLWPIFFLPYWCYTSYRAISIIVEENEVTVSLTNDNDKTLWIGGLLAEMSHLIVFFSILSGRSDDNDDHNNNSHLKGVPLLLLIASLLFFVETAAFLCVVKVFRRRGRSIITTTTSPIYHYGPP